MRVAVIPARGGSKRIPRKNIRQFCGKPMISWSIRSALASDCFDRVVVSTDDNEIANVALQWGADVPFIRPEALAGDVVGTIPVIRHAIETLNTSGIYPDQVCCIYATAPFLCASDLQRARKAMESTESGKVDYVIPVARFSYPIQRAIRVRADNRMEMIWPENFNARSQDLEEAWHDAGQFYWGNSRAWLEEKVFFSGRSVPVELPTYRVQDIDTEEDWKRAELLFKMLQGED